MVVVDSFRNGEHWEWFLDAKKMKDNNLSPGDSRAYEVSSKLPKVSYQFYVKAYKYRITEEMVAYNKLGVSYPTNIKFTKKYSILW